MDADPTPTLPVGRRIIVIGQTCSGKSTLGARLASLLDVPFVELDALHWKPGWVGSSDDEFMASILAATEGPGWVLAGEYHRAAEPTAWPRADTVVWLDLPLRVSIVRILRRSWRRHRSGELLWGTNRERFWPQLKVWNKTDSLIGWALSSHRDKRRRYTAAMSDPRWAHIRFLRLHSTTEIAGLVAEVEAALRTPANLPAGRQASVS